MSVSGMVVSIYVAPSGTAPMQSRSVVNALAGKGLEGDRYARKLDAILPGPVDSTGPQRVRCGGTEDK